MNAGEIIGYGIGAPMGGLLGLIGLVLLILFIRAIVVVEQATVMVVERFGKFHRRFDHGIHFLVPFVDRIRPFTWRETETYRSDRGFERVNYTQKKITRIDLRDAVMDFPLQQIITRDNVEISIHPMLLYRIMDPVRACYEIYDLPQAVEKLVQTTLRSIIGDMGLDDTLASREEINRNLSQKISNVVFNWGFQLIKVELLEILPSNTIQEAMHKQIKAERVRRAVIIEADGFREKSKTEAEGLSQARIAISKGEQQVYVIDAKGRSDARLIKAQAQAEALTVLGNALRDCADIDPTHFNMGMKYLRTFEAISSRATHRIIYFPYEAEVLGAVSQI